MPALLPHLLRELDAKPGDAIFSLVESDDDEHLLALVRKGDLDLAFTDASSVDAPLEAERLLDDPWVLVLPDGHELAALDRPASLEEVADLPLIALRHGSALAQAEAVFRLHGAELSVAQRVQDVSTLLGLVAGGLGVGLLPRLAADLAGRPLVELPIDDRLPARNVAVAWHCERLRTCTAGMFVDLAVEVAAGLSGQFHERG